MSALNTLRIAAGALLLMLGAVSWSWASPAPPSTTFCFGLYVLLHALIERARKE
jgi:hypothetical protein